MNKLPQVGDVVLISYVGLQDTKFIVIQINERGIYISPEDNSTKISLIEHDSSSMKWKIYGTDIKYNINFLTKNPQILNIK